MWWDLMGIIDLSYGVKKPPLMISSWMIINWNAPDAINLLGGDGLMGQFTMFNGKIHYFDWAISNSYVSHYQRVPHQTWTKFFSRLMSVFFFGEGLRGWFCDSEMGEVYFQLCSLFGLHSRLVDYRYYRASVPPLTVKTQANHRS